ncbi:MAG: divalent metal cation transporter [Planctomycetes bacterium]|nr:divalent metal cation transporter [Planctomycetota bacterium]
MNDRSDELAEVRAGLRMANPPDPAALRAQAAWLEQLDRGPFWRRWRGWLSLSGPGYLQSALTLGAGTATSSLFAGAVFGYELLWVAPLGMLLGVVMFAAIAHQTLSTGARPLPAMATHAGRPFAFAWAVGAVLASMVWHLSQYTLAASSLVDLADVLGLPGVPPMVASTLLLTAAIAISWCYGRTPRLIRLYERALKYMVWAIVLCLLWVVLHTDTDWGAVWRGLTSFSVPERVRDVDATTLIAAGIAAAVGINMVFLYPYSLLARGWGRAHRGLARCDLLCGMLLPYALATGLMVIAAANTLHAGGAQVGKGATIAEVGKVLGQVLGPVAGRVVFDLGMLAMAFSTISLHMVVCGFVGAECFGHAVGSRAHRLWTLLPAPAFVAPAFFAGTPAWLGVPTSIACGTLLPVTYIGFILLQRSRGYLGSDRPAGWRGALWLSAMVAATATVVTMLARSLL